MKRAINVFLLLMVCGCGKKEPTPHSYLVSVEEAIQADVPHYLKAVGQFVASVSVDIKAQVEGNLTSVLFTDGQIVEEDQLLMTIDPRIYESAVEEAKARLAEDQAKLHFASNFAETYGRLVGDEYVARLDYDESIQNVEVSKAAVENALAALKKAEVNLAYTQIRSPIKGYIGGRAYDPGNMIFPRIDQALATINRITPISVNFFVPGEYLYEIREKQKEHPLQVEATLPQDPPHPLLGSLYFIDNKIDPHTGMVFLKGTFPNEDERGWPGAFARVKLQLKEFKDAILVPQKALVQGHTGHFVFVVDRETLRVSMRMIGKGIAYKDFVIAEWGLNSGEIVVINGQLNLFDGAPIIIKENG